MRWLCEALWTRTDQELSRLERLFREFPWPSPEEIRKLTGDSTRKEETSQPRPGDTIAKSGQSARLQLAEQAPAVEFAAPMQSGVGLPRAQVPCETGDMFIFTPRPLISLRSLIIAWRRFRMAQRSGPRVELDIDATIVEQARRGTLVEPVLVPARRNQARLAILVDVSPSMVTWRHMNQTLSDSLERSQLAHTAIYFFDNAPVDDLYEIDALNRPVPLAKALEGNAQCALLVVSDAGAARGRFDHGRLAQTRKFIDRVKASWQPIAWANPMPQARWIGTTAERIAWMPGLAMFELTEDGIIHAIDYLSGKRGA